MKSAGKILPSEWSGKDMRKQQRRECLQRVGQRLVKRQCRRNTRTEADAISYPRYIGRSLGCVAVMVG